jgi:20S proteasome alpha/beta subunit
MFIHLSWFLSSGCVYGYDAIGSFELMSYCVTGSGTQLCTPLLDNQVLHDSFPFLVSRLFCDIRLWC